MDYPGKHQGSIALVLCCNCITVHRSCIMLQGAWHLSINKYTPAGFGESWALYCLFSTALPSGTSLLLLLMCIALQSLVEQNMLCNVQRCWSHWSPSHLLMLKDLSSCRHRSSLQGHLQAQCMRQMNKRPRQPTTPTSTLLDQV